MSLTSTLEREPRKTPYGKGLQWSVPILKALENRLRRDAQHFRPFTDASRHAIVGQESIDSGVAGLSLGCSPTAVTRLVMTVDVDAVQCEGTSRLAAHVLEECFEGIEPSIAHANATATVEAELLCVGVGATRTHLAPTGVFGTVAHAVRKMPISCFLSAEAAAGSLTPLNKCVTPNNTLLSAVADAGKNVVVPTLAKMSSHKKTTETHSNEFVHTPNYTATVSEVGELH